MTVAVDEAVSLATYAKMRGCAVSAVKKAVAEGRITALPKGRVDPRRADTEWESKTRARGDSKPAAAAAPAPSPPPASPTSAVQVPTYVESRARREQAEAQRAELDLAKAAGKLVEKTAVDRAVFEVFRAVRDRVMAVPRRCAGSLLGMTDVRDIEAAIAEELREALGPDPASLALPTSR